MTMTIRLPADLEATVRRNVESGHFSDATEVLREALRLLDDAEQQRAALWAALQVGIDQADRGETDEWTPELREQLRREADEMYLRGERPHPDVCP